MDMSIILPMFWQLRLLLKSKLIQIVMFHQFQKPGIGVDAFVAPFDIDRLWPSLPVHPANKFLSLLYLASS